MSVLDAIGNTPLVEIVNLWDSQKTGVRIMAKRRVPIASNTLIVVLL